MKDDIRVECSEEVRKALYRNIEGFKKYVTSYEKTVSSLIDDTNSKMNVFKKQMETHLQDFEIAKRKFFRFDGIRVIFFWASQVVSFLTLGLIVYFQFFK